MCLQSLGLGLSAINVDFYWYLGLFFFNLMPFVTTANTTNGLRRLPGQPVLIAAHLDPNMLQRPSNSALPSILPYTFSLWEVCHPSFFCSSRLKLLTIHLWSINLLGGRRETYERELFGAFCLFFLRFCSK